MILSYLVFEPGSVKNIIVLIEGKRALKCKKICRSIIRSAYYIVCDKVNPLLYRGQRNSF